jgi:hypothetical protein
MIITLKPIQDSTYNCLDVLLLTLAGNWNIDHQMMFSHAWRFLYTPPQSWTEETLFNDVIDGKELVEERNIEYYLEEYHGLKINNIPVTSLEQGVALIKQQLALNRPVAINIDARYCPWSDAYQKYDLNHYFLAIGIDEDKKEITGIDPYLEQDVVCLPFDEYTKKLKHCLCFEYHDTGPRDINWKGIIKDSLDFMGGTDNHINKFENMRCFAEDVRDHLDIVKETKDYVDVYASPFILYMKTVGFSRLNYAVLLGYLAEKNSIPELKEFQGKFVEAGNLWYQCFMVLIKMSMMPNRFKSEEIADIIFKVCDSEEKLYHQLRELCGV